MYDNIGRKIKRLAKGSCRITIILIWIAAIIFFVSLIRVDYPYIGWYLLTPIIAMAGSYLVWFGSWILYGFGELIDKTCDNENNTRQILKKLNEENTSEKAKLNSKHKAEQKAKHEAEKKAKYEAEEKARRKAVEKVRCEIDETAKDGTDSEQLSVSDIESAVSAYLNRRISISDISCTLIYVIPKSSGIPKEMHLDMAVGNEEFTSLDLFFDENRHAYFFKGRHLALDGAWRSEEEIFGFDVALFKSFNTEADEDD